MLHFQGLKMHACSLSHRCDLHVLGHLKQNGAIVNVISNTSAFPTITGQNVKKVK